MYGESATALATDDTSVIRSKLGGGNVRFVHVAYGPGTWGDGPILWWDHYPSMPSVGINQTGLSAYSWSLLFRVETGLIFFAIGPGIWVGMWLRRVIRKRVMGVRGFGVTVGAIEAD